MMDKRAGVREKNPTNNGNSFYNDIRAILQKARGKTYSAINSAMVEAYWNIGRRIVEEEQKGKAKADYGAELIKNLSKALNAEFGKGFSVANLWNFRQFYLVFSSNEKLYTVCRELSWLHFKEIIHIQNDNRDFIFLSDIANYKNEAWSYDLIRNWSRNRNTLEFLGIWEQLYNLDFDPVEFDGFNKEAGLNSFTNRKSSRQFYLTFKDDQKGYTLCSQLSWSHIRLIMRIDYSNARDYYLKESKSQGWSVRQLQRNINSHYFERLLSSSNKNICTQWQKIYSRPSMAGLNTV